MAKYRISGVPITEGKKLNGTDTFPVFIAKNHSV